jgi:cobalamin biosynthesis Mg chelatase CobN
MEIEKSTRQSPSHQQQTVEPDATQADPASSATPRQISTSQPGDSGESTGAGPDPIIFLVSIVLVVVVAVVVIYRLRRSRMDV